jgi:hypothetical protein
MAYVPPESDKFIRKGVVFGLSWAAVVTTRG